MFILRAPHLPLRGALDGVHILDVMPTLLDLVDTPVPPDMQGRSLVRRTVAADPDSSGLQASR
jgi:hypothetical protein